MEGSQYTDPRSAMRSTQVLPAASGLSGGGQTLPDSWNVDNVSAHAECVVYRDASSLRGDYKHCCRLFIHLLLFWPEFADVYGKGCLFKCSIPSEKPQHINQRPCCGAVVREQLHSLTDSRYRTACKHYANVNIMKCLQASLHISFSQKPTFSFLSLANNLLVRFHRVTQCVPLWHDLWCRSKYQHSSRCVGIRDTLASVRRCRFRIISPFCDQPPAGLQTAEPSLLDKFNSI